MKKAFLIIAILFLCACKREEYAPKTNPTYEYYIESEKQYSLGAVSFAQTNENTNDTLIYLFDDVNKDSKLELRFNNEKAEATLAYNDTIYYSDTVVFQYRIENGKLYGRFSFNAFNGFKTIIVKKGRFDDIKID